MSFDMTMLRRFNPDEELTQQEIKDAKDGVPNYGPDNGWVEVEGPTPPHEYLCGECTGSGIMLGFYPCKPCRGTGYIVPDCRTEDIVWPQYSFTDLRKIAANSIYPNERELNLLNNRISLLKAQLSKELQKKKSERSDINQLQQSINTLTKWKLQSKNSTQTAS